MQSGQLNHRCLANKSCVSRTPEGSAVTVKPDTLCSGCVTQIQKCLGELPHLAVVLRSLLGGVGAASYTSKVHGTHDPQPPFNVGALDLIDEIGDVIDRAGGLGVRVDNLIREPDAEFLVWQHGSPVKKGLSGVFRALAIRRVHAKAEVVAGVNKSWQRRAAPCPHCRLPTLGTWAGSDTINCSNEDCGAAFTRNEYDVHCFVESKKK